MPGVNGPPRARSATGRPQPVVRGAAEQALRCHALKVLATDAPRLGARNSLRAMTRVRRTLAAAVAAAALMTPATAYGHGLGGRTDLPIPDWLFAWAATTVLVASFVALGALWRRPLLERKPWRPLPSRVERLLTSPVVDVVCGAVGVGLLALVVYAGFAGEPRVDQNITPTFVYVVFWLGFVALSVLFGDVFRLFSPWRAVGRGVARLAGPLAAPPPLRYPAWLGRWPAAAGLLAFAWLELASTRGDRPETIALAIVVYSTLTWLGMFLFGVERWNRDAEAFSVYFNLYSRLSILERRGRRIGTRPPLSGLTSLKPLPGTVALIAVMIGSVSFDGFSAGATWQGALPDLVEPFRSAGMGSGNALQAAHTLGLVGAVAVVYGLYRVAVRGAASLASSHSPARLAAAFAHSLVPIALAYVGAHYVSLLLLRGQAIGALASDPLGRGADLLGTAHWTVDYAWIGANTFWYLQVAMVLAGHVAALALAHDRALVLYDDARSAVRSQYWMLVVMIVFTSLALWLLSEANKG